MRDGLHRAGLRSRESNALLEVHGVKRKYTRPYCPWQDGKAGRVSCVLAQEWQYRQVWDSEAGRASA